MIDIGNKGQSISVLKDPFKAEYVTKISLTYRKAMFEDYFSWRAYVDFNNGNTSGTQKFEVKVEESVDAFSIITKQIQEFINNLNK